MPALAQLVDPAHTAIVTVELQKGVVGDDAVLPALPAAVREVGLLDTVFQKVTSGRRVLLDRASR